VTPNHISTNPRLVKEASALSEAGYKVHLVFSQHVRNGYTEDLKILQRNPVWTFDYLDWSGGSLRSKSRRVFAGISNKASSFLQKKFNWLLLEKLVLNRNYFFQLKAALRSDADFFIAHNAGALAVAADAAEKLGRGFSFDAEDFHRGQLLPEKEKVAVTRLENHYLPKATYVSAASPLIGKEYERIYGINPIVINNVFPIIQHPPKQEDIKSSALKLFWFSQSVGLDRGLQDVFAAMKYAESLDIEFHIFGNVIPSVLNAFTTVIADLNFHRKPKIYFRGTLSPEELLQEASNYDVGLAIEPGFCRNNEVALSNKLFTYLLGGNAVIFSDTPAQAHFYQHHSSIGFLYKAKDYVALAGHLATYFHDKELLQTHKSNSLRLFKEKHNWDLVKKEFLWQVSTSLERGRVHA